MDDKDTSSKKYFRAVSGNWSVVKSGDQRWKPGDSAATWRRQNARSGAENARAEWVCASLPAGTYDVYAWWPNIGSSLGRNVAYDIRRIGGTTTVRVNQSVNGGQWNLLGRFNFKAGQHRVQIHNGQSAPGTYVAADAVRFIQRTGP